MFPAAAVEKLRSQLSDGDSVSVAALGAELERVWEEARAAWPGVSVEPARFCETLTAHVDSFAALARLRTKDLYLSCACIDGDPAALRAFDALIESVSRMLGRLAQDPTILADAQQHARQSVLPRGELPPALASYNGHGDLGGWLRVVLSREIMQYLNRGRRLAPLPDEHERLADEGSDDPELAYLRKQYEHDFKDAFAFAIAQLDEDDQRALRYAVVEQLTIDEIAKLERVHRATAARLVTRARTRLAELTRNVLQERLAINSAQLESVLRLVSSQIDVSVRRLLS
jgi:RNA polymerase sigma-70 factor (ECF subfamily)